MKLSQLKHIIKEEVKRLNNQKSQLNEIQFLTQEQMDAACGLHGLGPGVSHDCEPDSNGNVPPTYDCMIVCENGSITVGGPRRHSQDITPRGTNQQSGGYRGPEGPRAPMGPSIG